MIILSNCLAERPDEGCLKLAVSLVNRIKQRCPETLLISCGEAEPIGDVHFLTNPLLIGKRLIKFLRTRQEEVLLIPAVAESLPFALRVLCLSAVNPERLRVLVAMWLDCGPLARLLLRLSGAELITISRDSCDYYRRIVGIRASQLKAGVDTQRFVPVPAEEKRTLREKYGLPVDKPIVLHVGHLRSRRNLDALAAVDERFQSVLVLSGYAAGDREDAIMQRLRQRPNITIIDRYIPEIEEVYQLADVYLFPVQAERGCIDLPLSALEAASCGIPVLCTAYGELKELVGRDGFYEIESFEPERLNAQIERACTEKKEPRPCALEYDWTLAVETLLAMDVDRDRR